MQGNSIQVYLDKSEYFSGETVTGKAVLNVNGAPLPLLGVFVRILARETVKLSSSRKDEAFNGFMCTEKQLSGTGSKPNIVSDSVSSIPVFGGFLKEATQVQSKLSPGKYTYPIEFTLPSILPSCFRSPFGGLEYRVEARVKNPVKGGTDLVNGTSLNVGGSLYDMNFIGNHNGPYSVSDSKSFMFGKGNVNVTMSFPTKIFLVGDNINMKLDIENSMSKPVENISVSLMQRIGYYIIGKAHKTKDNILMSHKIDNVGNKQESHLSLDFSTPVNIPETISQHTVGKQIVGKCVRVSYLLVFESKVKGSEFSKSAEIIIVRNAEIRNRQHSPQQFIPQTFDNKMEQAHVPIATPQQQQKQQQEQQQQQIPQIPQNQQKQPYQQQPQNQQPKQQQQPQQKPPPPQQQNNTNNQTKKATRYPPPPPVAPIGPSTQNNQQQQQYQQPPIQQPQQPQQQSSVYQQPQYDYSGFYYPQYNQQQGGSTEGHAAPFQPEYTPSDQGGNVQEEQPYYYANNDDDTSWDTSNFQMYPSLSGASAPPAEEDDYQQPQERQQRKPAYEQFF